MKRANLSRYALFSIIAALSTIGLKLLAWRLTNSVSLLSDALESVVNLVAAIVALLMLHLAQRPPDDDHAYGHDKAEYFSSGVEGALIVLAAIGIAGSAIERLLNPQPLAVSAAGLLANGLATAINLGVGIWLIRVGRRASSIALEADGQHLLVDVASSIGVVIGLLAVLATGWQWLDAVIALLVAANIVVHGAQLVRRSALGLLDSALPATERAEIVRILDAACVTHGLAHHALRTRQSGVRRFMSVHVLFPDAWTIRRAHDVIEEIERALRAAVPNLTAVTHLEPIGDPKSWADAALLRPRE